MFSSSMGGAGGPKNLAKAAACVTLLASLSGGVAAVAAMPASASITGSSTARSLTATTVTIKVGIDLYGKVTSAKRGCVNNRRVAVIKQIGTRGGGDDRVVGHDTAAADGKWKFFPNLVEGKMYARVKATSACAADASRTVRVFAADRG
jgi:hypothetical protein